MNQSLIQFMDLIAASIQPENQKVIPEFSEQDLEELYEYAMRGKLLPVLYNTIQKQEHLKENIWMKKWKGASMNLLLRQYGIYNALRQLLKAAEERNIKLIVFKGCVLADLYPQYALRATSDTDLYVYPRDKEKAVQLLKDMGYEWDKEHSNPMVPVFVQKQSGHCVELHYCLWEDYEGRKMDILQELQLDKEESLIQLKVCNGMQVTTLGYEEHLIYQIFHVIKHFVLQGVSIRYVVDITLYVNQYGKNIDWKIFWAKIEKLQYEKFCMGIFGLGIRYLGMEKACMEGKPVLEETVLAQMLLDFINKGKIMEEKEAGWQILGIMTPYLEGTEGYEESKWKRNMKIMFPRTSALAEDYGYAKNCALLLPVAWIHRGLKFGIKRLVRRKDWYSMGEKLDIVNHRLGLMKELGLVHEVKETKNNIP